MRTIGVLLCYKKLCATLFQDFDNQLQSDYAMEMTISYGVDPYVHTISINTIEYAFSINIANFNAHTHTYVCIHVCQTQIYI